MTTPTSKFQPPKLRPQATEDDPEAYSIFREAQLDAEFKFRFAKFVEDFCETAAVMQTFEARLDQADREIRQLAETEDTLEENSSNSKKYPYVTKTSGEFLVRCTQMGLGKDELKTIISLCSLEDHESSEEVDPTSLILKSSSVEIEHREKKSIVQLLRTLRRGLKTATQK